MELSGLPNKPRYGGDSVSSGSSLHHDLPGRRPASDYCSWSLWDVTDVSVLLLVSILQSRLIMSRHQVAVVETCSILF